MKHNYAIDALRILACFSVVVLHVASQNWYQLPVTDCNWLIMNAYDACSRFGVPVFVMISGMLFLNPKRELPGKHLIWHYVFRILVIYALWSVFYGIRTTILNKDTELLAILDNIINGYYHLWYLPMIAALYLIVPLFRAAFTEENEKKLLRYLLLVFLILYIIPETLAGLNFYPITRVASWFRIPIAPGYFGYLILGYYLFRFPLSKKSRKWLYLAALLSTLLNILLGSVLSLHFQTPIGTVYDSFSLTTCCISIALFVFFLSIRTKEGVPSGKTIPQRLLSECSLCTLGIYLLHPFCIETLNTYCSLNTLSFSTLFSVPLLSLAVFLLCMIPVFLLRHIPGIGRYLC